MFLRLFAIALVIVFSGCTQEMKSTLLSAYQPCEDDCPTSGTAISGELSVLPDEGEIFASPEGTDLVEIAGSCKDLGRKSNRIIVQVFEGENDAVSPIIDNSIGVTCQDNISTTSLQSAAGVGKTCLVISQGIGLADTGNTTAQFPQCFNGRFSFQLRVGRIIRQDTFLNDSSDTTNPKVRYLVKLKLRTTDSITADSAATTMVVTRALPTPTFSVTANKDNNRCEINLNPSKFRDIRYSLETTWTGPTYAASGSLTNTVSGTVYFDKQPTFPPLGDGTTIEKFYHFGQPIDSTATIGLMPGITYTYRMRTADFSYRNVALPSLTDYEVQFGSTSGAVERSLVSGDVPCVLSPAYVANRTEEVQGTGTPNRCTLQLAGYNMIGYSVEWRVSASSPTWMVTNPNSGFLVNDTTNCRGGATCVVHGNRDPAIYTGTSSATTYIDSAGVAQPFLPNVPYYFAARHFINIGGGATTFDPGIDILAGEWSPATNTTSGGDYNHRCTFSAYP